jgi:hypothetical protein
MAEEIKKGPPGIDVEAGRIRFDFIKSNYFRVIHVEGVFGGNSPRGLINMAVFNERWPIPKQITHEFKEGKSGDEIERASRDAVVREVEAQLVMNVQTAKIICKWLQGKIDDIEKTTDKTDKKE